MRTTTFALALALASVSCHSMRGEGPSLGSLREGLDHVVMVPELDEGTSPRPSVSGPLRVAVLPPICVKPRFRGADTSAFDAWTDEEMVGIEAWGETARASGLVESVQFVPSFLATSGEGDYFEAARKAGRAIGADAVLLSRLGTTFELDPTAATLLDIAVLPAFIVPSTEFRSTAIVEGALLDVRTGYVYAAGMAESERSTYAPSLTGDISSYRKAVRREAVERLGARMIGPLVESVPTARRGIE